MIVIGSDGHYGVDTVGWFEDEMLNIADYDTIIIDTNSLDSFLSLVAIADISDDGKKAIIAKLYSNLQFIQNRLFYTLHSDGEIYVICSPRTHICVTKYAPWDSFPIYGWSPIPVFIENEQGVTKSVEDKTYERYFEYVKRWSFTLELGKQWDKIQKFCENEIGKQHFRPSIESIAINRYKKSLAVSASYSLGVFNSDTRRVRQVHESGSIVFLPPPTEVDIHEAINILLEDLLGIQQRTEPPKWINGIYVIGERELEEKIKSKQAKIDKLGHEVMQLVEDKGRIGQFKQLLYETGKPLEIICKLVLEEMGAEIDDSVEDFILRVGDKEAIVEVKGRERIIERKDSDQLTRNRKIYASERNKPLTEVKCILLGNPWRLLPLEERDTKEAFAQHCVSDAAVENTALVTTCDLFKTYRSVLEGSIPKEYVINRILSGVGIIKLLGEE